MTSLENDLPMARLMPLMPRAGAEPEPSGLEATQDADGTTYRHTLGERLERVSITMQADCRRGSLNGSTPNTIGEAELMNAACQVACGRA